MIHVIKVVTKLKYTIQDGPSMTRLFDKQQLGDASLARKICVVLRSYGSHANIMIRFSMIAYL